MRNSPTRPGATSRSLSSNRRTSAPGKLLQEKKKASTYDVLVAYSGGKDSTYTLDVLVNKYNLRVLALTFDNTFISPRAEENIRNVCGALGADLARADHAWRL